MEIIVPRLGWSMEEGAFVAWLKEDGGQVKAGEPIFSIEGDKAVQEVESIDSGILRIAPNAPKPGESIRVGDVLGYLVTAGDAAFEPVPTPPGEAVVKPPPAAPPTVAEVCPVVQAPTRIPSDPPHVPSISPRAVRVAAELGVDWTVVTGSGRTGRIRERDIRAAAEASMRNR